MRGREVDDICQAWVSEQVNKEEQREQTKRYNRVNHPAHYCDGGIETIDFIEAKKLDYHL